MHRYRSTLALAAALFTATAAGAQQPSADPRNGRPTTISVVVGVSQWDLSGTCTAPVFGARIDREFGRVFLGEAGFTAMRPAEQFGERATYAFPEVQLQAQLPIGFIRPYLGVGGGYALESTLGHNFQTTTTLSGAGGIRALLPNPLTTIRAELRVRGVGTGFTGSMAEWMLGLGRRF